ncbi:MAG TPA: hypothetical protein VHG91_11885 [Longimicrobium sp.]|nr:hypothetical protein [Longimicrobium sp.]
MRKIKLDVDALAVDTFEAARPSSAPEPGTVNGHARTFPVTGCYSCYPGCDPDTAPAYCP